MPEPFFLLVEDSEDDAFFFNRTFRDSNYALSIVHVENGEEAIKFLQEASKSGAFPKAIFLDLKMPVLNGFEVLSWIQENKPAEELPVIVLSGSEQPEDKKRAFQLGAVGYIVKPLDLSGLGEIVEQVFGKHDSPELKNGSKP